MKFFKSLSKCLPAVYLVIFFVSVSTAAANGPSVPSDTMLPTNDLSIKTSLGSDRVCFNGYFSNSRNSIASLESKDLPAGSSSDCFGETPAIAIHKDGDKTVLSLAPSFSKITFNPIDDIKNLQLIVQYKFWF